MIEPNRLAHVVALAEHRNYSRAAAALQISQPALTRSIQSLERKLGVRLFDRGRFGAEATAFGDLLVERGQVILQELGELEVEVQRLQGLESGELSVSIGPYPNAILGQEALARMLVAHPGVSCRIRIAGWRRVALDVLQRRSALGLADLGEVAKRGELAAESLGAHPLYFFCRPGHELLARRPVTLTRLFCYPWAGLRAPTRISGELPTTPGRAGRWDQSTGEFVPAIELDDLSGISRLARDADILVVATLTMVEEALAAGRVCPVPFDAPWLRLDYGFITLGSRSRPPATRAFIECVRRVEDEVRERQAGLRDRYL